jgi:hypothetical protein
MLSILIMCVESRKVSMGLSKHLMLGLIVLVVFFSPRVFTVALLILLSLFIEISTVPSFYFYMLMICWLLAIIMLCSIILFLY